MKIMGQARLFALVAGAVWIGAAPARAAGTDGFCAQLKSVAADAQAGFQSLSGARLGLAWDDGGGDDDTRYAATRTLPGALGCGVDRDHADGEDVLSSYVCWFAPTPTKVGAVMRVADEITDCIGRAAGDRLLLSHGDVVAAFDANRPGFVIDVTAGRSPKVVFEISGK